MELWIHLRSELEMKDHLHQESYARSCQEIEELKRSCYEEGNIWKTTKIGRISCAPWSGITNSESIEWSATKITRIIGIYWKIKIFSDPDLLSSYDGPTFLIKLLISRVIWNAAKYTREYEYSWKRFWLSTCSTRSWWIIQFFKKFGNTIGNRWRCREFWQKRHWEKRERRTIEINTFTSLFSVRARRKSLDDK